MTGMYTDRLLDHFRNPRNRGRLDPPGQSAEKYNPLCGDRIQIDLRISGRRVDAVRFEGRGCAVCLGAASILTEVVAGRTLDELRALGAEEFLAELQSAVRPSRRGCALLPWAAFRRAAFGETDWPLG